MVCGMSSVKLYGCAKGARQTLVGNASREERQHCWKARLGVSLSSLKPCHLCLSLSRVTTKPHLGPEGQFCQKHIRWDIGFHSWFVFSP